MEIDALILKKISVGLCVKRDCSNASPRTGGRTAVLWKRNHLNNLNNSNARVNLFRVFWACRLFCGHACRTVPPQIARANGLVRAFLTSTAHRVSTGEPDQGSLQG
jgi:hypothetical protein